MSYITVPLGSSHKKETFACGKPMLDNYLKKQAGQDIKRKLAACFVLEEEKQIKGYYTLSSASVGRETLPGDIIKKLPPAYSDLPTILLGRLAVNKIEQGKGFGESLLLDALKRSYFVSLQVGSMAVVVDPLDEEAGSFYSQYDFIWLPDSGKMFLPMGTIAQLGF